MAKFLYAPLLIIFLFYCNVTIGQSRRYSSLSKRAIESYENGMLSYSNGNLVDALNKFNAATNIDENFTEAYFAKSEVYLDLEDYNNQFNSIAQAIGLDSTMYVTAYYNAGVALCNLARFDDAMTWFDLYKRFAKNRRVKMNPDEWIEKAMQARKLIENPVPFIPVNLGDSINSEYDEYWPSITLDEEEMVFTVLLPRDSSAFANSVALPRTSKNYQEDFFISKKVDGIWQKRQPMVDINTRLNEGAQALSADGKWMFFTACGRPDSQGSCDLYFSKRKKNGWSTPINVGAPVNSPYWESQPCFSADGQTLYFVSNRPGGKGSNDIWYATIKGFSPNGVPLFSSPINMGDSINTKGDEASPFIHADNNTLYFSSDGWPGVGKKDIFLSRRDSADVWHKPVNLGYPINTASDETGLVINADGTRAYYASNGLADKTKGRDIYYFALPQAARPTPVSYMKGHVYDGRTRLPLGAKLSLIRLDNGKAQVSTSSDEYTGQYMVSLPCGSDYALIVSKDGYLFHSQNFALKENYSVSDPYKIDVYLSPLIAGEKVALRNVFFETNSYELKRESFYELDRLASVLLEKPKLVVEISGHTDNVGSAEYNSKLSRERAFAAYTYLLTKGIPEAQLKFKGCGFKEPIKSNDTEDGRALNRRIEVKVISNK